MRLHFAHRLDQRHRARSIADPPAGHRIGLGHAIDGQGPVIEFGFNLRGGAEHEIVEHQMFIHVVGHAPHMRMAQQHIGQGFEFIPGIPRPGRVGRRVEQEPLGGRRNRRLKLGRGNLEIRGKRAFDHDRGATCQ